MRSQPTRRSRPRQILYGSCQSPTGRPLPLSGWLVPSVRDLIRKGFEVEVRVNGYQTVVRGGDVRTIIQMLERREIGEAVRT